MVENKKSVYDEQLFDPLIVVTGVEAPRADEVAAQVDLLRREGEMATTTATATTPRMDPPQVLEAVPVVEGMPKTNDGATTAGAASGAAGVSIDALAVDPHEMERQRRLGAGVATGVIGLLVGGPLLAMIFGFGAAYATEKPGAAGDTARAIGDLALSAKERAIEIDRKHKVVDKSQEAAKDAWNKAQELDRQHHFLSRTKQLLTTGFQHLSTFVHDHRLIERGVETVGKGAYWVAEKIAERFGGHQYNEIPSSSSTENDAKEKRST